MKSSFYIVLPSNGCPNTQPNNEANNYMIDWESALEFQGEWEAALTDFSFNFAPLSMKSPSEIKYTSVDSVKYKLKSVGRKVTINAIETLYTDDRIKIKYNLGPNHLTFLSTEPGYTIVFNSLKDAEMNGFTELRNSTTSDSYYCTVEKFNWKTDHETDFQIEFHTVPVITNFSEADNYEDRFTSFEYTLSRNGIDPLPSRIKLKLVDDRLFQLIGDSDGYTVTFRTWSEAKSFGFTELMNISKDKKITSLDSVSSKKPIKVVIKYPAKPMVERILPEKQRFTSSEELVTFFKKTNLFEKFVISEGIVTLKLAKSISSLALLPEYARTLGFLKTNIFLANKEWVADKKTYLQNTYNQYYIYSSVVDRILVGGVHVPLLKAVWVESKHDLGDVINESIDHPMYINVSAQSINNIEVQIRDDSGDLINFPYGSKSSLTIHFRKNG